MEKRKLDSFQTLSFGIGFNAEDLKANRNGAMSKRQRVRLSISRIGWTLGTVLALLAFPACVSLALPGSTRKPIDLTFIAMSFVASGLCSFLCWQHKTQFDKDLRKGTISRAQGVIHLEIDQQGGLVKSVRYALRSGGVRSKIDKPTFLAFKNGDPYIIYYAPYSQTLLSAEWLRE